MSEASGGSGGKLRELLLATQLVTCSKIVLFLKKERLNLAHAARPRLREGNCHGTVTSFPTTKRVQWVLLMTMTGEAQITNCSLENVTNVLDHPGQHTIGNLDSNAGISLGHRTRASRSSFLVVVKVV